MSLSVLSFTRARASVNSMISFSVARDFLDRVGEAATNQAVAG